MQEQQQPSVPKDQRTNQQCGTVFTAKYHQGPPSLSSDKHSLLSSTVKDTLSHSSTLAASRLLGTVEKVPALEKLNGLEREHVKLSLSQTQAEVVYFFQFLCIKQTSNCLSCNKLVPAGNIICEKFYVRSKSKIWFKENSSSGTNWVSLFFQYLVEADIPE